MGTSKAKIASCNVASASSRETDSDVVPSTDAEDEDILLSTGTKALLIAVTQLGHLYHK